MKITLLIAGTNDPSNSATLANSFVDGIKAFDANTIIDTYYINRLAIDHFNMIHYEKDYAHEADFSAVQQSIETSDGLIIATPIWNFGVPAHLKNLIDRMGSFALDTQTHTKGLLRGKPFYTLFTGGAPEPAWHGIMKKTTSFVCEGLRYFGATPIGTHFEGKCTTGVGTFGLVVNQRKNSLDAAHAKGEEFAAITKKYATTGALPIRKSLQGRFMKIGENIIKKVF